MGSSKDKAFLQLPPCMNAHSRGLPEAPKCPPACAVQAGVPGVYTDVLSYKDFIDQQLQVWKVWEVWDWGEGGWILGG